MQSSTGVRGGSPVFPRTPSRSQSAGSCQAAKALRSRTGNFAVYSFDAAQARLLASLAETRARLRREAAENLRGRFPPECDRKPLNRSPKPFNGLETSTPSCASITLINGGRYAAGQGASIRSCVPKFTKGALYCKTKHELHLLLLFALLAFGQLAFGQATTGRIDGVVQDSSGAVIVGANVTATETKRRSRAKPPQASRGILLRHSSAGLLHNHSGISWIPQGCPPGR